jgi:hypothetical protein
MSEQATSAAQADPALNGKGAAVPPGEVEPGEVELADRAMGSVMVGLGVFLLIVGIDRYTGGALGVLLRGIFAGGGDGETP